MENLYPDGVGVIYGQAWASADVDLDAVGLDLGLSFGDWR
jgi:hypothetical protein